MSQIWLEINQESRNFFRILLCSGNLQELSALYMTTSDLFPTKYGNFSTFFSKYPLYTLQQIYFLLPWWENLPSKKKSMLKDSFRKRGLLGKEKRVQAHQSWTLQVSTLQLKLQCCCIESQAILAFSPPSLQEYEVKTSFVRRKLHQPAWPRRQSLTMTSPENVNNPSAEASSRVIDCSLISSWCSSIAATSCFTINWKKELCFLDSRFNQFQGDPWSRNHVNQS